MFVTVIALTYVSLVSQQSYGHFLKLIQVYLNNTINRRHFTAHIIPCYLVRSTSCPAGDRIVTLHPVTSLHPVYRRAGDDVDLFKMSLLTQAEMIIIARSEEAT